MTAKPLTGRKVFMMFFAAFSVIISVNLLLAYKAVTTFPGLEVKNSYVASQGFDEERAAQLALGWDVSVKVKNDQLILSITDQQGAAVAVAELQSTFGRATHVNDDQIPAFEFDGVAYVAPVNLAAGNWNLRLVAIADDGTRFHQRIVLYVKPKK